MVATLDIETRTQGKPDPLVDEMLFIGIYEHEQDKYHFFSVDEKDKIKEVFKRHRVIVSFNGKHYDEPIMKRFGCYFFRHLHIDLREVVKKRSPVLGTNNESKSLSNLAKFFKLSELKMDFDYSLLQKDKFTPDEINLIKDYTLQDVKVTAELFQKLSLHFGSFKEFMSPYDVRNYKWLTSSLAVYSYKVICYATGIKEEYNDNAEHKHYEGGYVASPSVPELHDDIFLLDFNSLYPHNMIQGNLFSHKCSCCAESEKWSGNEMFPIKGRYCTKKQRKVESVIHDIYKKRLELKKNKHPAQYALKIVINTLYGLSGNPTFKSLYNHNAASDCTLIGRESIKLARKIFQDAGYVVAYSDTDSVFVKDSHKNIEILKSIKNKIVQKIKQNLPFPADTFDMGIDEEIKHIWFFEKDGEFLKKFYIYVKDFDPEYVMEDAKDLIVIKGLPMIKNDSSRIGYEIFKKHMMNRIVDGNIKFSYTEVKEWLYDMLNKDIMKAARRFKVFPFDTYKKEGQIQAQIAKVYGEGTHKLLPNNRIGVGKGVRYCSLEEFKSAQLDINSLVMTKFWSEMQFFTGYVPKKPKILHRTQRDLSLWANF